MNISHDFGSLSWERTRVFAPTLDAIVMLIRAGGTLAVIYILTGRRRKNGLQSLQGTDTLLLALSASDILLLICLPFQTAAIALGYWPFSSILCKVISFLGVACNSASVFILAALAVTRYLIVVYPTWMYRFRMRRWLRVTVILMWVAGCGSCSTSVHIPPIENCAHPLLCVSIWPQPVGLQYHSIPVQFLLSLWSSSSSCTPNSTASCEGRNCTVPRHNWSATRTRWPRRRSCWC